MTTHDLAATATEPEPDTRTLGKALNSAPMDITGRVAYHSPGGVGIKFIYRDGGGSRRIRELIRRIRVS